MGLNICLYMPMTIQTIDRIDIDTANNICFQLIAVYRLWIITYIKFGLFTYFREVLGITSIVRLTRWIYTEDNGGYIREQWVRSL